MVRIGTLPMRLLSLKYGAHLVYSEEIIDHKMLTAKRVENKLLGTVDFVLSDETVVFRTCDIERDKVIFQMGTSCPIRALKVAKLVENDVAGIDINMGCPKEFSIKGGMGAALLTKPNVAKEILSTLVNHLNKPVTCKIRVLNNESETIAFSKLVESTGIAALAVHGRRKDERPKHPNRNDLIKEIAKTLKIPVIANGGSREIKSFANILQFKEQTGCSSIMLARAAQWNPMIFCESPKEFNPVKVCREYTKIAIDFDQHPINVKYVLQQFLHEDLENDLARKILASGELNEICSALDLMDYFVDALQKRSKLKELLEKPLGRTICPTKRKLENGEEIIEMDFKYIRRAYLENRTPKLVLYEYCIKQGWKCPTYEAIYYRDEHLFEASVTVNSLKYKSTIRDKSKKLVEQAAASVCLQSFGINDGRKIYS
ncbi:DgyrCDS6013 [Dimorphilus gyrociliatus]|uniref:DgyrCDS6013 n=1 Tax=Dimorphilus gyrociliatus TaxID=2664684 RepID=A0A7I8VNB1_9ANNE|nr:DgyrCDS6013 [Dimorphilus gyrociliatus]